MAGRCFCPHIYDGRKRTFYFTQYQGFRQVLGTTQVMPVPALMSGRMIVRIPASRTCAIR